MPDDMPDLNSKKAVDIIATRNGRLDKKIGERLLPRFLTLIKSDTEWGKGLLTTLTTYGAMNRGFPVLPLHDRKCHKKLWVERAWQVLK